MIFCVETSVTIVTIKISPKLITRNCNFSKYFYNISLNYSYSDFIQCPNTVSHGIYNHKYSYEFHTFVWVTIIYKPS